MKKRNKAIALVFTFLLILGVVFVAADYDGGGRGDDFSGIVRFVGYGILPAFTLRSPDVYVTYNGFAEIMQNMLNYEINEKFTFASGFMYIRPHEALGILEGAGFSQANTVPQNHFGDFLTFRQLSHILDDLIQIFVSNESIVSFEDVILNGTAVISFVHTGRSSDFIVANMLGNGNLIIAYQSLAQNNNILLNNVNITGDIVMTGCKDSVAGIVASNTSASNFNVIAPSNISLVGDTSIESVNISADAGIATQALTRRATLPNVEILSGDVALFGGFNNVSNYANGGRNPVVLAADGHIAYIHSAADMLLIGDVSVREYSLPSYADFNIINRQEMYRNASLQQIFEQSLFMSNLMFLQIFFDAWEEMFSGMMAAMPTFTPTPIPLPPTPPPFLPPQPDPGSPIVPEEPKPEEPVYDDDDKNDGDNDDKSDDDGYGNADDDGYGDNGDDDGYYGDQPPYLPPLL